MAEVTIPYAPRPLQRTIHAALEAHRFGVVVCHRRFGKSVLSVNHLIKGALTCARQRPRFAYIGPTYRQAKQTIWDYLKYYSRPIPGVRFNESELRADYPNGGQVRVYGGDDPDSLRGIYLDGVVADEYGLHKADIFSTVLRPALSDREGWALFPGTPNGKNQFFEMLQFAQARPEWFAAIYKASETGILSPTELEAARTVMTPDEYAQEFECSFEAAVKGAIYAKELETARSEGRICTVPYDPALPVDTDWDIGIGDAMAVWFSQSTRSGEVRLIDFYEATGEGFPHYASMLQAKGYTYGKHWAPHDIQVRELASGRSRLEAAAALGIRFEVCPRLPVEEGIHAARLLFPRCWFDAEKTKAGLEALQHYRRDYNQRLNEFKATPVHDWACVVGDTKVLTRSGTHQIQYLPESGEVLTPCGWKRYESPRLTRRNAPLVAVTFDDGLTVKCTPEHRFLTANGWRFASDLQTGSLIQSSLTRSRSISMAVSTAFGRKSAICHAAARSFIETCGLLRSGRFLTGAISIIETATRAITRWLTWNAYPPLITSAPHGSFIGEIEANTSPHLPEPALLRGMLQRSVASGTVGTPNAARDGRNGSASPSRVSIAARRWMRSFVNLASRRNTAPRHAKPLRIASVTPLSERADVWCLTVPDGHMWSLENGAVTHNSHAADAWRGLAIRQQPPKVKRELGEFGNTRPQSSGWMS